LSSEEVIQIASSYRIIKNSNPVEEKKLTTLDVSFYKQKTEEMKKEEIAYIVKKEDPMDIVKREIRKNLEDEIEIKKRAIIEKTKMDLAEERLQVLEVAKAEGYEEGFLAGKKEALEEAQAMKEEALAYIKQAEEAAKAFAEENERRIIRLSAKIAEKIIQERIDEKEESIMILARPVLQEYGKSENVVLTCHPSKVAKLKEYLPEMNKTCPNAHILILQDKSLGVQDILIENENKIIDLSIKKQLKRFIELATS